MGESKTAAITAVKNEMKFHEWQEQVMSQQASGLTAPQWCAENGVNYKTYCYHLRKVRERFIESEPEIVPLSLPKSCSDISIEKNGVKISLPSDISAETIIAIIHEIC